MARAPLVQRWDESSRLILPSLPVVPLGKDETMTPLTNSEGPERLRWQLREQDRHWLAPTEQVSPTDFGPGCDTSFLLR